MVLKALSYLGLVAVFLMCLYGFSWYQSRQYPVNVLGATIKPDNYLLNSKLYITEKLMERSRRNLIDAIRAIDRIKEQADPLSKVHLETGLEELNNVLDQMNSGRFSRKELNNASIIALNSLTYYQIKSAEAYILEGRLQQGRMALTYGMQHVKNALVHAEGSKKENEVEIYSEMNTIVRNEELSQEQIIGKLELMLNELEDLEIAYH